MYKLLVSFANWFAVTTGREVSIFDRVASWAEPKDKVSDNNMVLEWNEFEGFVELPE